MAEDCKAKIRAKVYRCLRGYTTYRHGRRINDFVMTRAVQCLEKRRMLREWRRRLDGHVGAKLLAYTFQRASVRQVFAKMAAVGEIQAEAVTQSRERALYYRKKDLFHMLKGHWERKQRLE